MQYHSDEYVKLRVRNVAWVTYCCVLCGTISGVTAKSMLAKPTSAVSAVMIQAAIDFGQGRFVYSLLSLLVLMGFGLGAALSGKQPACSHRVQFNTPPCSHYEALLTLRRLAHITQALFSRAKPAPRRTPRSGLTTLASRNGAPSTKCWSPPAWRVSPQHTSSHAPTACTPLHFTKGFPVLFPSCSPPAPPPCSTACSCWAPPNT